MTVQIRTTELSLHHISKWPCFVSGTQMEGLKKQFKNKLPLLIDMPTEFCDVSVKS